MSEANPTPSPYKGLVPYSETDSLFFFGRQVERDIIISNLLSSRLTLLYGPSGVGKSSVLRAGVLPALRERARANIRRTGTPELAVAYFSSWRDSAVIGLTSAIEQAVAEALGATPPLPGRELPLLDMLSDWTERLDGDLLLVLDQFEEYFLYHREVPDEGTFAALLPQLVADNSLRVNVLVSIREDALAKLDLFEGKIPRLLENYIRIEHLDPVAARDAIIKPVEVYNRIHPERTPVRVESTLVTEVLRDLASGRVMLGNAGQEVVVADGREGRIETPYLQLVMTRLWDQEMEGGSSVLRRDTLDLLGGAERIVRTHLDATMSALSLEEQQTAARLFRFLVTPSRTKIAHTVEDLAEYSGEPQERILPTLERLARNDVRILRPVSPPLDNPTAIRYEIFHDVLAAPILDWRARYAQHEEQQRAEKRLASERAAAQDKLNQERRRVRRLRFALVGITVLFLGVVGLALYALQQRDAASKATAESLAQQQANSARELAAVAVSRMSFDPQLSLALAVESLRTATTSQGEDALRTILTDPARAILRGHTDTVNGAVFSPDRKWLATFGNDRTVRIWATATWRSEAILRLDDRVTSIAFNPDSKRLAAADGGLSVHIWDVESGQPLADLTSAGPISIVTFSPDGKAIAAAGDSGLSDVLIADSSTGRELSQIKQQSVVWMGYSPDGRILSTGDADGNLELWQADTGQIIRELRGHTARVLSAAFSPDAKQILTASADRTARLWDVATGNVLQEFGGHTSEVFAAFFLPEGKAILTASRDDSVRLWQAGSETATLELKVPGNRLNSVSVSPDGKLILTAGDDQNVRIWDSSRGTELIELRGHEGSVTSSSFSADGQTVVSTGEDQTVRVWELNLLASRLELTASPGALSSAVFNRAGTALLTAGNDGVARMWDLPSGALARDFRPDLSQSMTARTLASFANDDQWVVTAGDKARVWDARTGTVIYEYGDPRSTIRRAELTNDRKRLVLTLAPAGYDGGVLAVTATSVWELGSTQPPITMQQGAWPATSAPSPDGKFLATKGPDNTAVIRDMASGIIKGQLGGHNLAVTASAFTSDSRLVATGGIDGLTFVWDPNTGDTVAEVGGHPQGVSRILFSPDNRYLLTQGMCIDQTVGSYVSSGNCDPSLRLWESQTGRGLGELKGHTRQVLDAAFSPNSRFVVTASADGTARIWDAATGTPMMVLAGSVDWVGSAAFGPDSKLIVTAAGDGLARIYQCDLCGSVQDLLALAMTRLGHVLTCQERQQYVSMAAPCETPAARP